MSGRKDDAGKPRLDLVPALAELEVARVLTHGASRYGADNWRRVEGARWRYLAACMRHLNAWRRGERLDEDSGLSHLAHAACCVLFLLELELRAEGEPSE